MIIKALGLSAACAGLLGTASGAPEAYGDGPLPDPLRRFLRPATTSISVIIARLLSVLALAWAESRNGGGVWPIRLSLQAAPLRHLQG